MTILKTYYKMFEYDLVRFQNWASCNGLKIRMKNGNIIPFNSLNIPLDLFANFSQMLNYLYNHECYLVLNNDKIHDYKKLYKQVLETSDYLFENFIFLEYTLDELIKVFGQPTNNQWFITDGTHKIKISCLRLKVVEWYIFYNNHSIEYD